MSSFAIFTDKNDSSISVEVHFNLWNQSYNDNYLDVGIMLCKLDVSRTIYVWLPFKAEIEEKHVNHLKTSLGDIDVINAIFNENYVLQRAGQSKWIYLKHKSNNVRDFKMYLLEFQDIAIVPPEELGFNQNENISIAKINVILDESDKKNPVYLRFRIKLPESTEIIHEYNKPHHWIRGAFSKNYVIDFRYNDKRSFSAYDNEIINTSYCLFQTTKLHFLLMTKVYVEVECSTDVKKRRLEPNIWNKYISNTDTKDIIAYHATKKKENADIGSWEFFAKQTVENENWRLLIIFVILTIALGAIGSLIGNHLDKFICGLLAYVWSIISSFNGGE